MAGRTERSELSFGFWASNPNDTSQFPWPTVSVTPDTGFLERVARVEAEACEVERFRGMSWSRLTGKLLGNADYLLADRATGVEVRWPGDYATHYLAAGVAPDPEFAAIIERVYESLPAPVSGPRG